MNINKEIDRALEKVNGKLSGIFDEEYLNRLARETGFIRRESSRIGGKDFVELMTTGITEEPAVSLEGMCDILKQINPEAAITPQALDQRINNDRAVRYLKEVFGEAIDKNLSPVRDCVGQELLQPFGNVFVEDSSQIMLHEKLSEEFKGSGGSASESAVKIDVIYEIRQSILRDVRLYNGSEPDQSVGKKTLEIIKKNDLILRDLGYFSVNALKEINEREAFFLTRLLKGTNIYIDKDDIRPIDLIKYIDKKCRSVSVGDLNIYPGKEKIPCRLIIYRLPEEIVNELCRKANEKGRKKGKQPSAEYLGWLRFGFYLTNVGNEIWAGDIVGTVYRLRWQIELIFKHWKSLLHIHILKGTRSERIRCFIYGRLITVTIITVLCGYASQYALNNLKRELSFHKLISWLKRNARLREFVRQNFPSDFFENFIKAIPGLCKQKRKRNTTRRLVDNKVPYMESF